MLNGAGDVKCAFVPYPLSQAEAFSLSLAHFACAAWLGAC